MIKRLDDLIQVVRRTFPKYSVTIKNDHGLYYGTVVPDEVGTVTIFAPYVPQVFEPELPWRVKSKCVQP